MTAVRVLDERQPVSATIIHRGGDMEDYDPSKIAALIAELQDDDDDEHPSIGVSHESGWTISGYGGGLVVWEDVETDDDESRHMDNVSDHELAHLMRLTAEARFDEINAYHWLPGHG
ncbi:hypothetical protein Rhe02_56150 [Rhizocola hellebori]|uniref:Uncharacterized protein n=1 Tax=Rhizocola hellebori TaxID=1392758 RepID=A0A8J3QB24_9ACTN|nr:hypothetical protein [Rhizocola hellebori]GIH07548.1 hypothetical protein Rhe02_56150 [Rhizocola hellebori]